MQLSRYEQETVINYNQDEGTATIYTHDPALIRRLDVLVSERQEITRATQADGASAYILPKKWVKVRAPKKLSDETRQLMAERARERFHKKEEAE